MPLTYAPLSSGSVGNALWLRGGGLELLVDCGISARATERSLDELGARVQDLQAILVTHAHDDHIRGAAVLTRKHGIPIWATREVCAQLVDVVDETLLHPFERGSRFSLGDLQIESVPTRHDAAGSVAFVLSDGATRFGLVTDLGVADESIEAAFAELDGLAIELNHDLEMLRNGPYPGFLKKRILGAWGHLSNEQGASLLGRLAHPGLSHVTLAHLSERNNTPDLARRSAEAALETLGANCTLAVAKPRAVGEPVTLHEALSPIAARREGRAAL